jgi:serine/threonine-protein kinase RsbW
MRTATVIHVDLDVARGRATIASAGHLPALLLRPGAESHLVWDGRSPPLGVFPTPVPRIQTELDVPPGARLLLYTDGLIERRGEVVDEGLRRLVVEAGRLAGSGLQELVDGLAATLLAGGAAGDDVCLLAVGRTALPGGQA